MSLQSKKMIFMRNIYERNVFRVNPSLRAALTADLTVAASLLPEAACRALQRSTPIYVNTSLTISGDAGAPTAMRHMCYHSKDGEGWLAAHQMSTAKAGAIEIYCGQDCEWAPLGR